MSDTNAITYDGAGSATQDDARPDPLGPFAAIMNTGAAATCKITTARGQAVTIYMLQGVMYPIATRNVWSTGGLSTIIGFVSRANKGNGL